MGPAGQKAQVHPTWPQHLGQNLDILVLLQYSTKVSQWELRSQTYSSPRLGDIL